MISKRVKAYHLVSSFFPTSFYNASNRELSSKGFKNFIIFYQFTFDKKCEFIAFYIDRKFYKPFPKTGLEPFIKSDEDLFHSQSQLPYFFWLGVFLTLFYTAVLLFVFYRMQKKRMKIREPKTTYSIEKEKDNPLFVLCENVSIKEDIFNYYQSQKSVCLEKINTGDFTFNGIKALEILKHLCQVSGIDETKALENLGHMGIRDLTALPICHDIILKIYAAVSTAADSELIVLNDFLKNESREMQKSFFNLLLFLEKPGKKIIYLSCEMKQTASTLYDKIKVDGFKVLPMDLNNTSLR